MKTFTAKPADIKRDWFVLNAKDVPIGRLATQIAVLLQGKHKPMYTRHVDTGDYVVVTNCETIKATGKKEEQKVYYRHTGYPGGIRARTLKEMREKFPERIIEMAVRRMLPKGPLGRAMLKKLKVYTGDTHPHESQQPREYQLND